MILAEGLNFLSTQLRDGKDRFGGKRIQENHYFFIYELQNDEGSEQT
jgi:hypothetical protein